MDDRVIFLLEDRRQAQFARQFFMARSIPVLTVGSVADLCTEIERGAGTVIITENVLAREGRQCLLDVLNAQPSWSEIPVIVLVFRGGRTDMAPFVGLLPTDVMLLEAPVRVRTLLSAVQTGMRSRKRQLVLRDLIGELEDLRNREQEARQVAEAATRAKAEFLASMSHDLRTPLSGIIGMLSIVQEMDVDEEAKGFLEMADRSAHSLLRLISDILDFSRAEAGKISFVRKKFVLRDGVRSAVEAIAVQADQKGLAVVTDVADDVPPAVVGDEGRIRQVLVNLLGNSLKFTDRGEIRLEVRKPEEEGKLLFCVKDTGIGIAREKVDQIFGRYVQADSSIPARYGGTGIGLALSNELVEKMGGRMWVTTSPGEGSTFCFVLPLPEG